MINEQNPSQSCITIPGRVKAITVGCGGAQCEVEEVHSEHRTRGCAASTDSVNRVSSKSGDRKLIVFFVAKTRPLLVSKLSVNPTEAKMKCVRWDKERIEEIAGLISDYE